MTTGSHSHHTRGATLARAAGLGVGVVFLAVGILGFVPGVTTNTDDLTFAGHHGEAELFGIFQVSVLHNLVHLLFGVLGLASTVAARQVPTYLVGSGLVYGVLTVYGLVIDRDSGANFVPVNSADNWLHLGLTIGLVVLGVLVGRALSGDIEYEGGPERA